MCSGTDPFEEWLGSILMTGKCTVVVTARCSLLCSDYYGLLFPCSYDPYNYMIYLCFSMEFLRIVINHEQLMQVMMAYFWT
jgi:hypothetical protein